MSLALPLALLAGCQAGSAAMEHGRATVLPSLMVSHTIPDATPSGMAEMPPATAVEEPLAPLLAENSATLQGRGISVGQVLGSPGEYEGLAVQIVGKYIPAEAEAISGAEEAPEGEAWAVEDSSGRIPVVGAPPQGVADRETPSPRALVVGRVALAPGGEPYVVAAGAVALANGDGSFDVECLMEAERLAKERAAQGLDMRLAQVYIATAQWLNLSERPEQANAYLMLALEILQNPGRFKDLGGELPPRTPIHPFPTPPGTLVPLPEGGSREQ